MDTFLEQPPSRRLTTGGLSRPKNRMKCHVRICPSPPSDGPEGGPNDEEQIGVAVTTDSSGRAKLDLPNIPGPGGSQRCALLSHARYDSLHDGTTPDETVFEELAAPLLEAVEVGENAALLAYGQTGTGKTHNVWRIILPQMGARLFGSGGCRAVRVACLQIYHEQLEDLLSSAPSLSRTAPELAFTHGADGAARLRGRLDAKLRPHPNAGLAPLGLRWVRCTSAAQLQQTLDGAAARRRTGETRMNRLSSRAHAVVLLQPEGEAAHAAGGLAVVDLAGSERLKRSGSSGRAQREAIAINSSLHALSHVISSLAAKHPHVPVRASKLTMVLEGYLRRGARLALLVCLSPSPRHLSESCASLEFAHRAMQVVFIPPPRPPPRPPPPPPANMTSSQLAKPGRAERTPPRPEAAAQEQGATAEAAAAAERAQRTVVREEVRRELEAVQRQQSRELEAAREQRHALELGLMRSVRHQVLGLSEREVDAAHTAAATLAASALASRASPHAAPLAAAASPTASPTAGSASTPTSPTPPAMLPQAFPASCPKPAAYSSQPRSLAAGMARRGLTTPPSRGRYGAPASAPASASPVAAAPSDAGELARLKVVVDEQQRMLHQLEARQRRVLTTLAQQRSSPPPAATSIMGGLLGGATAGVCRCLFAGGAASAANEVSATEGAPKAAQMAHGLGVVEARQQMQTAYAEWVATAKGVAKAHPGEAAEEETGVDSRASFPRGVTGTAPASASARARAPTQRTPRRGTNPPARPRRAPSARPPAAAFRRTMTRAWRRGARPRLALAALALGLVLTLAAALVTHPESYSYSYLVATLGGGLLSLHQPPPRATLTPRVGRQREPARVRPRASVPEHRLRQAAERVARLLCIPPELTLRLLTAPVVVPATLLRRLGRRGRGAHQSIAPRCDWTSLPMESASCYAPVPDAEGKRHSSPAQASPSGWEGEAVWGAQYSVGNRF